MAAGEGTSLAGTTRPTSFGTVHPDTVTAMALGRMRDTGKKEQATQHVTVVGTVLEAEELARATANMPDIERAVLARRHGAVLGNEPAVLGMRNDVVLGNEPAVLGIRREDVLGSEQAAQETRHKDSAGTGPGAPAMVTGSNPGSCSVEPAKVHVCTLASRTQASSRTAVPNSVAATQLSDSKDPLPARATPSPYSRSTTSSWRNTACAVRACSRSDWARHLRPFRSGAPQQRGWALRLLHRQ